MLSTILVTGAPGNVGSEVVKGLQGRGIRPRIAAYSVEGAQAVFGDSADIVRFDFTDPSTYQEAFEGIERMFLVRPPALSNVRRDIAPALQVAHQAGVKHVVFLSIQGVEQNRIVPHARIEDAILDIGMPYTFLRASFFMQNLSTTHRAEIRDQSIIALPVGKAKTSFIDVRDIAAVAVEVLAHQGYANQKFTLTGCEALSYDEVATKLTRELQRSISYTSPSAIRFFWRQVQAGSKLGYALVVTALYLITRFGNASTVTQDVVTLLKRHPITFDQFAHDYRESWV